MRARVLPIISSRLSALISIRAAKPKPGDKREWLTKTSPRRIAANIAKLPELTRKP
jgi:hypothetical protein